MNFIQKSSPFEPLLYNIQLPIFSVKYLTPKITYHANLSPSLGRKSDYLCRISTKVCTGYLPHRPSIYEYNYNNETDAFKLERYLGGYYRDFVPKMVRRRSRIKFDKNVST